MCSPKNRSRKGIIDWGKVGWMGVQQSKVSVGGWVECSRVSEVRGDRRPCMCSQRIEGTRQTCEPRPQVGVGMEG